MPNGPQMAKILPGQRPTGLYMADPNPPGLISRGNININDRPIVPNPREGGSSTVFSSSYGDDQGEHLIPLVSDRADSRPPHIMGEKEGEAYARKTGQNLGTFDTPGHATAYAHTLHLQQSGLKSRDGRTYNPNVPVPSWLEAPPDNIDVRMPSSMPQLGSPTLPRIYEMKRPLKNG